LGLGTPLLALALLGMMVLPVPPLLLDLFFTFNIALSLIVLLMAVYTRRPLDFSIFPSVLLIATLLRLALNVASTRVVLLNGHSGTDAAGHVIESFGAFVMGGNFAVGLAVFVHFLHAGRSILAGALTLALLILPVIIIASQEAIKAVPNAIRLGAYALGATRWETIRHHVLPLALPGVMTGTILALSRAVGEAAPLILIGALAFVPFVPNGPLDEFTVIPIQIFNWVSRPQEQFHELAAAASIVLLIALLTLNAAAIVLRNRYTKRS
jgi:phosphate ABC transporter permease subunit PstA